jgi:cyclopropane fatty-acyl-phospholipid synthase-like methyltransferase
MTLCPEDRRLPQSPHWKSDIQQKMRRDWDARARENAFFYIASSREDWTPAEFFASGEQSVHELIVADRDAICHAKDPKTMRVLEIGCGAGRMTRALASFFGEAHGVDVSREMVERGRELLADRPNAFLHLNSGADLQVLGDLRFDFAFSFIVFQHIPSKGVIENYVREVSRLLRPGAVFKFQLQGSPKAMSTEDDTWVGAPFTEREAAEMAERNGFELIRSAGAGGQYFWLWYAKPARWRTWHRAVEDPLSFERLRQRSA